MAEKVPLKTKVNAWAQAHPWMLAVIVVLLVAVIYGGISWYVGSGKASLEAEVALTEANTRADKAEEALNAKNLYVARLASTIEALGGEVPTENVPSPSELQKLLDEARSLQAEKKLKEADERATRAIGMDAKSAEAWVLRAEIRRAQGNLSWRTDLARAKALNAAAAQDK